MRWPTCTPYASVAIINVLFFVLCAAQTVAYITPYLPYSLRKFGTPTHNTTFAILAILALLTGAYNCFAIYSWRRGKFIFAFRTRRRTRRLTKGTTTNHYTWVSPSVGTSINSASRTSVVLEKEPRPSFVARFKDPRYWLVAAFYVVSVAIPILAAGLPRDLAAEAYWRNSCKNHHLSAVVVVRYPRPDAEDRNSWNVTARVDFFKHGVWQYEMDLVRMVRDPMSFPVDGERFRHEERIFVFSVRNSSRPVLEGGKDEPVDTSYSIPGDSTQHFPDLPFLPVLNATVLQRAFAPRPPGLPLTFPYNDAPLSGVMSELLNDAPIARVIYRIGWNSSEYSYANVARPATGHQLAENQGNLTMTTTSLQFDGAASFSSIVGRRWRWKHPDGLRGDRRAEACLPPNPSLSVPLRMIEQIGHARAMPPAYWTPWVPKNLKVLAKNERCRRWKVCALPKEKGDKIQGVRRRWAARNSARADAPILAAGGLQQWREDVEKTWAVAVGLFAAEVESWSMCCGRGE